MTLPVSNKTYLDLETSSDSLLNFSMETNLTTAPPLEEVRVSTADWVNGSWHAEVERS